jgi:phosphate-selective porin OprO/OprP
LLLLMASAAQAQPGAEPAIESRLAALEQQVELLRQAVQRLSSATAAALPTHDVSCEALEQETRNLTRQIEIERARAARAAAQAPGIRAGREGFALGAGDGSFQLRLRGYLHSDARLYVHDHEASADSFLLRRVRPVLEATLFSRFDFRLMPDFGDGKTVLQDAYLDARFHPYFQLRVGKYKAPMGLERLASAVDLRFIERGLPTALVPNRDVGLMIHGDSPAGALTYALGVFNGVPDGASADADDHDGKDVVARAFVRPFNASGYSSLQGLGVGFATSYGIQRGTATAPNVPAYRSGGQQIFFRFRFDGSDTGTTVADGVHVRVSAQGWYYRGRAGVIAEHVLSAQRLRRASVGLTAHNTAWQVAGSYVLTGERASSRGVAPARVFDVSTGGWGAVELVARYNALAVDPDVFPFLANPSVSARSARASATGVNWYLNTGVRISANYERTRFAAGAPAGRRATEHAVFGRFQVSF